MDSKKERNWMLKKDVMRYLFMSQRALENHMRAKVLKAYKLVGKIYFDKNEIDQALEDGLL